ncbi:hypothetical protein N9937_00265 [bacterium]|nr:hypothetical protein [bacterium]
MRKLIEDQMEYFIIMCDCDLIWPYDAEDSANNYQQVCNQLEGVDTVMATVNNKQMPTFVRTVALEGILPLLSDKQLMMAFEAAIEEGHGND